MSLIPFSSHCHDDRFFRRQSEGGKRALSPHPSTPLPESKRKKGTAKDASTPSEGKGKARAVEAPSTPPSGPVPDNDSEFNGLE